MHKIFQKELLYLFFGIFFISIILQLLSTSLPFAYTYDTFISYKGLWQWITSSLVHWNWMHWFLNISNLFILIFLFEDAWSSKKFIFLFSIFSFFIILSLYIYSSDIKYYVGMSGVLYGMAIYGALKTFFKQQIISTIVLIYIGMKLNIDKTVNHYMGVDILLGNMKVIEDVHWYGAISGLIYIILESLYIKLRKYIISHKCD